jgi:hypothetical protein
MGIRSLALALVVVTTGCGVPSSTPEQAEDLSSLAAEGALLAAGVADGESLSPFAETHARALDKRVEALRSAISDPMLHRVASDVVGELGRLAASPGDSAVGADVRRRLDEAVASAQAIRERAP